MLFLPAQNRVLRSKSSIQRLQCFFSLKLGCADQALKPATQRNLQSPEVKCRFPLQSNKMQTKKLIQAEKEAYFKIIEQSLLTHPT